METTSEDTETEASATVISFEENAAGLEAALQNGDCDFPRDNKEDDDDDPEGGEADATPPNQACVAEFETGVAHDQSAVAALKKCAGEVHKPVQREFWLETFVCYYDYDLRHYLGYGIFSPVTVEVCKNVFSLEHEWYCPGDKKWWEFNS